MPIFRKKDKPALVAAAAPSAADYLVGDPDALRFKRELAAGRWEEFHDFITAMPDWGARHFYLNNLSDINGRPEWLDEWVAKRPDSAVPILFRGSHTAFRAWEVRGGGRAHMVRKDAWPEFYALLVDADRDLARAAEVDDKDPLPHARGIWTAMGLSLGQAEVRRRFGEAHKRDHLNGAACYAMIQATARKWGGSHAAMFEFARWVSREAPDGHPGHWMIALAHIEGWIDADDDDQAAYFTAFDVKSEILAAADRCIRSARYAGGLSSWRQRNDFAFCFWRMRHYDAMLAQMQIIGTRVTPAPWHYAGTPSDVFERVRQAGLRMAR